MKVLYTIATARKMKRSVYSMHRPKFGMISAAVEIDERPGDVWTASGMPVEVDFVRLTSELFGIR